MRNGVKSCYNAIYDAFIGESKRTKPQLQLRFCVLHLNDLSAFLWPSAAQGLHRYAGGFQQRASVFRTDGACLCLEGQRRRTSFRIGGEDVGEGGVRGEDGVLRGSGHIAAESYAVGDDLREVEGDKTGDVDRLVLVLDELEEDHREEFYIIGKEFRVFVRHERHDVLRGGHRGEVAVREGHGAGHVAEVDPVVDHGHDVVAGVIGEYGRDLLQYPVQRALAWDGVVRRRAADFLRVVESGGGKIENGQSVVQFLLSERSAEELHSECGQRERCGPFGVP